MSMRSVDDVRGRRRGVYGGGWNILVVCALCSLLPPSARGFNLDAESALVHQGTQRTLFGFSVALHNHNRNTWLLVGAPQSRTQQAGVERGGAVFKCSTERANVCHEVPFDRTGSGSALNNATGNTELIENKSQQWFGATVHSSAPNGVVVACAPRYVYFSSNFNRREPIGACFVAKKTLTDFQPYSPCKTSDWGYHRQGHCQAGFSAAFSQDGNKLYLGAVGSWYWQGQVFVQNLLVRTEARETKEQSSHYDDSYMGYSMATGEFSGDGESDVVVGVPRGNNLTGKVLILNSSLVPLYEIAGEQIASYFGYALAVSDVDGDSAHDVIISAPFHSNFRSKDGTYETGRVYVVYQKLKGGRKFSTWDVLDGKWSRCRFGLSLTSLGDLNRDSYGDFAVGAPYAGPDEGPEGGGAVYVYHGSPTGVLKKPSQVIFGSDVQSNLRTFGYSLSGGLDMDNNEYTDVVVGAYSSDKVVFLRSRAIVGVVASLNIEPEKINLDDKGCSLLDRSQVACVVVSTCLQYTGHAVPILLDFEMEIVLDVGAEAEPRLFFLSNEYRNKFLFSFNVSKGIQHCRKVFVYITSTVRDKLSPITIQMDYRLKQGKSSHSLRPILDQATPSRIKKQVNIQKNCGKDNVCVPQLSLFAQPNRSKYVLGSKEKLEVDVAIQNFGEDAFESIFYLFLPFGVHYVNIDRKELDFTDVHISCSGATGNVVTCNVGNPLPQFKNISFKVLLMPFNMSSSEQIYIFPMEINSTNPELSSTLKDNTFEIKVPVAVEVEILLSGISETNPVYYNKSRREPWLKTKEEDLGPEIIHLYDVINLGPSEIEEAEVVILWPSYTLSNQHLLYLVEQPEVIGNGHCERLPNVNPLNLTVSEYRHSSGTGSVTVVVEKSKKEEEEVEEEESYSTETNRKQKAKQHKAQKKKKKRESDNGFQAELSCGPTLCTQIHCRVYDLMEKQHVLFRLRSRLSTHTLQQFGFENVTISSKLVSRVTKLPFSVEPEVGEYQVFVVSTLVNPSEGEVVGRLIPWWIIAAAVCTGVLLLALLIILLWKVGFFIRKRPHDELERESLHKSEKNGILELSDEAL